MTRVRAGLLDRLADRAATVAARMGGLAGWRRAGCACLLGIGATGGLPPLHILPLVVLAFTGLAWQMAGAARLRDAAAIGWCFGFGHFASGLYWIAYALLTDPERYAWMVPFAIGGLAAGLALFVAGAMALVWVSRARAAGRILVLAVAWTAAEWVRGHVLTGFPWNLVGTVWAETLAVAQWAATFGAYGLSLVTVAIAAAPATLVSPVGDGRPARDRWRWAPLAAAGLVLAALWTTGALRIAGAADSLVAGVRLRLVQPNIPQALKWDRNLLEAHFALGLELSASPGSRAPTHVVWPETAVPFNLANEPQRLQALAQIVPPDGLLLTGAVRAARSPDQSIRVWNSVHAIDSTGRIVATYDKFHLVPFGEYVPLRWFPGVSSLAVTSLDFSAGPGTVTLTLPGLPALSPLICYEVIFPRAVTDPRARPRLLLNLTNDAWFGISSGPYQHFAAARMRAIEEGLPLVRAANNGISAVVDPHGRIIASLGLGERGIVDADLPEAIDPTLYAQYGDLILLLAMLAALLAAVLAGRRDEGREFERTDIKV